MSTNHSKDRASLCTFTFADGRQCRTPRRNGHPYLCTFHARKEAQAFASQEAGKDIAFFLSGNYVSAGDLSFALSRLFAAVAQGQIKPKTAATLAFLGQTLVQTLHLSQNEYISAFGTDSWESTVAHNFKESGGRQCPPAHPAPQLASVPPAPTQPAQAEASPAEPEPSRPPNEPENPFFLTLLE
ncbi:MAG: hypothetical protein WA765_02205 [Candidatus Acidiferrum sp.]